MSLSSMSRLAMFATVASASIFSSCSEEGDPGKIDNAPTPEHLKGVATQYFISVTPGGKVHSVYMEFTDQHNKKHKLSLNPAEPGTGRDQASHSLSTDNFLRDQSVVQPNEYNQRVLMKDNEQFTVRIDVSEEDQGAAGLKSLDLTVPSNVTSVLGGYTNEERVIELTKPENRKELINEVTSLIRDIHDDPDYADNAAMRFKVILDPK